MGKLDQKIALITGGTTGIGLATAKLFLKEGAQVVVTGQNPANVTAAQKELGSDALAVASDTSNLAEIPKLMEQIRAKHGRIDIVFANAGIGKFQAFDQVDEALYDRIFNVNVKGLYFTVQHAARLMPNGGVVLLTGSVAGSKGFGGASVYSATKAAVRSLGRSLAAEMTERKIRVNVISPGPVDTPILRKGGVTPEQAEQMMEGMRQAVPLKRLGQSEEVAEAALYLSSPGAAFVTGIELLVDGGIVGL
jgi:NAD(P)-dependent dehydrogenase (short-subunit alcohol dehydrogenase family)